MFGNERAIDLGFLHRKNGKSVGNEPFFYLCNLFRTLLMFNVTCPFDFLVLQIILEG